MNQVALVGRLTKDLELRKTGTGKSVLNFTLAIDNGKDRQADFVNCVTWDHSADYLANYAHKGDKVSAVGKITNNNYENSSGKMVYEQEVTVFRVEIVSSVDRDQQQLNTNVQEEPKLDITTNDLPF